MPIKVIKEPDEEVELIEKEKSNLATVLADLTLSDSHWRGRLMVAT